MKNQNKFYCFIYIYISFTLFNFSYQIKEDNIINIGNLHLNENPFFKLRINYLNKENIKDMVDVKIESETEDLNNYYYRYYYVKTNQNNIISDDIDYYNEPNKTLILSDDEYIICEMRHKINNNKIYLKSEVVNDNKTNIKENFSFYDIRDNSFSVILFFSTFCSATTISVILILIDLKEDKKIIKTYNLCTKDRANQEYNNLRNSYINKNIFKFAFFLMKYTYPIFNIFTIYNYDHPRYIRFFIVLIKMILNIFISMGLFLIPDKTFIIDKENEIHIGLLSFLNSLFASLIISIISQLITKRYMGYDKIRANIWKPKMESLRKYIYYTVKKDILFNSKWHCIRNRMISYTRICGDTILRDKPGDKYKTYADNKQKNYKASLNINTLADSSSSLQIGEDKESVDDKFMANTFNIKTKHNNSLLGYHAKRKKTFYAKTNEKDFNSRLYIEKGVQSFSISKFGQNDLKLKTVQKIEDIRNRYILNINDSKFDETLDINSFVKTFDNLEIETLENYTYISTDSINNQLHKTSSESNKIFINLIVTLLLLFLLTLVNLGLDLIYVLLKNKFDGFDRFDDFVCFCLFTVLAQITIFNFILNYLFDLFISFLIFKSFGYQKSNCCYKILYKFFIEKYIKYIYKIRLLINKYNKELEFIDK